MTLRRVHPRVLLVEGKDEQRVLPELLELAGIPWPRVVRRVRVRVPARSVWADRMPAPVTPLPAWALAATTR